MKKKLILFCFACCVSGAFLSAQHVYYVAPTGGNDINAGTDINYPFATLQHAIDVAIAGDSVIIRGGLYNLSEGLMMSPSGGHGHSGTYTDAIVYTNYNNENPIFDFTNLNPSGNYASGIFMYQVNNIQIKGITIRNVKQHKMYLEAFGLAAAECANLRWENITVHHIDGNAIRSADAGYGFASDTSYMINCDAYNCCDSLPRSINETHIGGAADGLKFYQQPTSYFIISGCRAWECSDDGFDLGGGTSVITNCWSFKNGYLDGDGSGFKMGGIATAYNTYDYHDKITRIVENCITAENSNVGFFTLEYEGYYRANARIYNNLSYNEPWNFRFSNNVDDTIVLAVYRNNIGYVCSYVTISSSYNLYTESNNSWYLSPDYPQCDPNPNFTLNDADFVSLNIEELKASRKADGSLPDVNFGHLVATSDLINSGLDVGLPYAGSAPDIGAFEFGLTSGIKTNKKNSGESLFIQNYPNPFNSSTTITYQLVTTNHVRLNVVDMSGREVASLVDEVQQPGYQSVKFDAGNLESGIYFYSITAGKLKETRKLMLSK